MFYSAAKLLPVLHISYISAIARRIYCYALFTPIRRRRNYKEMVLGNNEGKVLLLRWLFFSVNDALIDFSWGLQNTDIEK